MIIDSDVLIWYFKSNINAKLIIDSMQKNSISAVSYMELMQGMKNKMELSAFEKLLVEKEIKIIQIDKKISTKASEFIRKFTLSDSMQMGDTLIAATCIKFKETLCTGNTKHFKCIANIQIEKFIP